MDSDDATSITLRNLDDFITRRLRLRAGEHGRSMEEEALDILRCELAREPQPPTDLVASIRNRFAEVGFVDLPEIPRAFGREPPRFDEDA